MILYDFLVIRMRLVSFIFLLFLVPSLLFGGYTNVNGKWSPEALVPIYSVQEHYDLGYQELHKNNWDEALINFLIIAYHFQDSPFYHDAIYYSGVCYYFKSEFDVANKQFDRYLNLGGKLKHFEKVFDFKLEIADNFAKGIKKHLFGYERLPKWSPARKDALALYDEIIAALPAKEIATQAMYNKANLLRVKRHYHESIETLQTLSRRFPKHSLAAESFLRISEIYLDQSKIESQNPDLIALAQVNIQRFLKSFPSDERVSQANANLVAMQEVYAQSLYDTGRFYERKKKPDASAIYYKDAIRKYPQTKAASKSEDRLAKLGFVAQNAA